MKFSIVNKFFRWNLKWLHFISLAYYVCSSRYSTPCYGSPSQEALEVFLLGGGTWSTPGDCLQGYTACVHLAVYLGLYLYIYILYFLKKYMLDLDHPSLKQA